MLLRRTCKQITTLMIAREDRPLTLAERWAVQFHLLACKACPTFERQLLAIRQGLNRWKNYRSEE